MHVDDRLWVLWIAADGVMSARYDDDRGVVVSGPDGTVCHPIWPGWMVCVEVHVCLSVVDTPLGSEIPVSRSNSLFVFVFAS